MTLTTSTPGPTATGLSPRRPSPARTWVLPVDAAVRAGWTAAAILVAMSWLVLWPSVSSAPWLVALVPIALAVSAAGMFRTWATATGPGRLVQLSLLVSAVLVVAVGAWSQWRLDPAYGTDAAAFNQQAAEMVLAGQNPYGVDLSSSLDRFGVPPTFHTLRVDGEAVDQLSYPAGSVLAIVPLLALGVDAQAANIVSLVAWLLAAVLLFRLLPSSLRWAALLLVVERTYNGFVLGGVTDPVFLVPLLLAVWRWDRFADPLEHSVARWIGPMALGLACSVKQTPWFFATFLLAGVWLQARSRHGRGWPVALRYGLTAVAAFAVVNVPFVVADPLAWVKGTLLPLIEPTTPDGQGIVTWLVLAGVGGGDLAQLSRAGLLLHLAALAAFVATYPRWRAAWPFLVVATFLVPSRSLGSYFIMALPAVLLAVASVRRGGPASLPPTARRLLAAAAALAGLLAASLVLIAVTANAPLRIEVGDLRTTGSRQTVSEVEVRVTNLTARPLMPHFTVNTAGRYTDYWDDGDNPPLAPGETRDVRLQAPGSTSMPGVNSPFFVQAFTADPPTVSKSEARQVSRLRTALTPSALPSAVHVGKPVQLKVQLRDEFGAPVHRSGVPVSLGQVVYAQAGLLAGTASINGAPQGQSPVIARTNADGVAEFSVVGIDAWADPLYLQAWVEEDGAAPGAYSNVTSIRFTDRELP